MSLVGKVGRKTARARLAMAVVYTLLTIGALTTLYPFVMMVSTGFKGPTDQNDNRILPSFWQDDRELLTKYLDDKYAGDASWISHTRAASTLEASAEERELYRQFLSQLPPEQWLAGFKTPPNHVTSRLTKGWHAYLRRKYPDIDAVNAAFNEINGAYQQVTPPPERLDQASWRPKADQKWADWISFKSGLPAEFRIPITGRRLYQEFLRTKYKNQFRDVPLVSIPPSLGEVDDFHQVSLRPRGHPELSADEAEFYATGVPRAFDRLGLPEEQWGRLLASFRNEALDPLVLPDLPIIPSESAHVAANAAGLRWEFTTRNYAYVIDYIALNGRALLNTVIFCGLTILIQLTVNPIAAYALSRYPMKATAKILLFLLATMAFPAEVAMIPSFLLLKDLGLLNTFAALVLPAAASGFMIFLLKGFFDSLPQEVFESGQIDGAPEWLMMLRIAFPLSKPVLGYMALLAFMGSYGAFIYAFLVAQNREMWTLMVFIYQLQLVAPKSVMMAAVTIAALPTLVVFLFAQRVIMRGIVLPGER